MRAHLFALILVSIAAFSAPYATATEDAPDLAAGSKLLKEKSYDQALDFFNTAARANPDSVDAHFGRAQALQALGRRHESVKEFQLCLLLKPNATLAAACNKELDYMTTRIPPTMPLPTLSVKEVEKTSTTITNQASERIQALQKECNFLRTPTIVRPGRRPTIQWTSSYSARSAEARRRSEALRECADALRNNMACKPSEWDGVYLSPQCTNLYVRNYVHFDAQKPEVVEPLKASQLSFSDVKKNCQPKKK